MKLNRLLMPFAGLALISLANPSHAVDYKIYPGAACQPLFGSQAALFRSDVNQIVNVGASNAFVTCPLERDRIEGGALDPGARVRSSGGALLTCTFFSMDQNGVVVSVVNRSTRASSATPLIFSGGVINTAPAGSYAIRCQLPPGGMVINYSNGEDGNTDSDDGLNH
jgi:hypothetical protein